MPEGHGTYMEMMDGIIRYLERKFREAQGNDKKYAKIAMMDVAWVLDTLLYVKTNYMD